MTADGSSRSTSPPIVSSCSRSCSIVALADEIDREDGAGSGDARLVVDQRAIENRDSRRLGEVGGSVDQTDEHRVECRPVRLTTDEPGLGHLLRGQGDERYGLTDRQTILVGEVLGRHELSSTCGLRLPAGDHPIAGGFCVAGEDESVERLVGAAGCEPAEHEGDRGDGADRGQGGDLLVEGRPGVLVRGHLERDVTRREIAVGGAARAAGAGRQGKRDAGHHRNDDDHQRRGAARRPKPSDHPVPDRAHVDIEHPLPVASECASTTGRLGCAHLSSGRGGRGHERNLRAGAVEGVRTAPAAHRRDGRRRPSPPGAPGPHRQRRRRARGRLRRRRRARSSSSWGCPAAASRR